MKSIRNKQKLLILGGSSLLAYLWIAKVYNVFDIYITKNKRCINYLGLESIEIDLFSKNSVKQVLDDYGIDIVLNCVGFTNIEACENNPFEAFKLNSNLPGIIASACNSTNTKLIHIN